MAWTMQKQRFWIRLNSWNMISKSVQTDNKTGTNEQIGEWNIPIEKVTNWAA